MPGPRTKMLLIACALNSRMRPGWQTSRSSACAANLLQALLDGRDANAHGGRATAVGWCQSSKLVHSMQPVR